jgi:hypothetical protein
MSVRLGFKISRNFPYKFLVGNKYVAISRVRFRFKLIDYNEIGPNCVKSKCKEIYEISNSMISVFFLYRILQVLQ